MLVVRIRKTSLDTDTHSYTCFCFAVAWEQGSATQRRPAWLPVGAIQPQRYRAGGGIDIDKVDTVYAEGHWPRFSRYTRYRSA
jgi:hypothetical protein